MKIPVSERVVYLIPDTDYFTNSSVKSAYDKLIELLVKEGSMLNLVDIRGESEDKLGVDDFIIKYSFNSLAERIENPIAVFYHNFEEVSYQPEESHEGQEATNETFKTAEGEVVQFPEMTGFIKELYDWILETSPVKQPILTYGSVIATIGTVLCHLYRFNNAYPVFYQMFVARSGSGKDRPLKVAKIIFGNDSLENYLGLLSYRSDASIIDTLPENRSRLDILDEVDSVLKISKSDNGFL